MDLASMLHSHSTDLNTMLNSGLQNCGVNSMQQPFFIPWTSSLSNSSPLFTVLPGIKQPILSPLSPPENSLILLPLSSVSSQTPINTAVIPVSYPAIQQVSTIGVNEISQQNHCPLPPAVKSSVTQLTVLSQPALLHSQNMGSCNVTENSVMEKGIEISSCQNTASSLHGRAVLSTKNPGNTHLKEGETMTSKRQRISSTEANLNVCVKSDQAKAGCHIGIETKGNILLAGKDSHFHEQSTGVISGEHDETMQINNDSISEIISNLPPGWKVVGLTSLDNPSSHIPCTTEMHQISLPSGTSSILQMHSLNPHSNSSPPDVVSVDLNVSSAMSVLSSSLAIDSESIRNLNNCSVQLCNTPSSNVFSVKSEIIESQGIVSGQEETLTGTDRRNSHNSDTLKIPSILPVVIKTEPEPWFSSESENKESILEAAVNQWTVVGVTSIPFTPVTNTNPLSQNVLSDLSTLTPSSSSTMNQNSSHQNGASVKPIPPKMTILNVPLPKISHSAKNSSAAVGVSLPETHLPNSVIHETSSKQIDANKKDSLLEDSKWTIVGVTVAPSQTKTGNMYSSAGAQLASLGKDYIQNLNLISKDAVKHHLVGVTNKEPSDTSFSEMIKALSVLVNKGEEGPTLDASQPQLNDEWKVVGITQLPMEQNPSRLPENFHSPCSVSTIISSINTYTTSTTSISNGIITCPTVKSSSSSCISSSTVAENYLNSDTGTSLNSSEMSSTLNSSEYDSGQHHQVQFLNDQTQQQPEQQLEQIERNQESVRLFQKTNRVQLLHDVIKIAQTNYQLSQTKEVRETMSELEIHGYKPILPRIETNSTKPILPRIETNGSKPVVFRLESNKSKFQCIEKYICKSDCVSRKAKDMCVRCMKKHTVSHLLKMKRMKDKEKNGCSDADNQRDNSEGVGQNLKIVRHLSDKIMRRLNKVERESRSRPLHSYAGNRKMFSKPASWNKNISLERISLRSGTQVPVWNYESDCNENEFQNNELVNSSVKIECKDAEMNDVPLKTETRSAARKRKLKVPRKMIADLDYHPFDSSSDSN